MENQHEIDYLNQMLSNCFILYVKLHRYCWYVKGKHALLFTTYFETLYMKKADELNLIAERILIRGGKPLATMSMFVKQGSLMEANADDTIDEIISQLIQDFKQIVKEIKETGLPLAERFHDEPTINLLVELQSRYERDLWKLQAYREEMKYPE